MSEIRLYALETIGKLKAGPQSLKHVSNPANNCFKYSETHVHAIPVSNQLLMRDSHTQDDPRISTNEVENDSTTTYISRQCS